MKDVSQVTACVADHGLFLPIALKLAEQYKHVYYWSPWDTVAPKIADGIIGEGFEKLERVNDIWSVKDDCDLFIFPDVGFGGLQKELISQGKPVWGHHGGDILETNRGLFLKTLREVGMEIPAVKTIRGMTALREHLKNEKDKFIKISRWRGDMETMHWRSWKEDEHGLDEMTYKLGAAKEIILFYVFDKIETDIEDGIDTYCIDGQFPKTVMHGMELKDRSYFCSVQPMTEIDERVTQVNEKFSPVLKSYGYRGFFSSEVRISGEKGFFIDPTCRAASPPSQVMTELFSNLGEIIWSGANGELIEPELSAKFGVQILLSGHREADDWFILDIPESIRQWVKCGFACEIDGRICEPPHALGNMAGWLVATGNTIEEAIKNIQGYAKELPSGIDCDVGSLAALIKEAQTAKEEGIEFTGKKLPEPSVVLEK